MNFDSKPIRALGLCSGGLDSILSALVLQKQGIAVEWITFDTPFFSSEKALKAGRMTHIPVTVKKITPVYLEMLKNPPCGYGRYMNPCVDCHAMMFRLAGKVMEEKGFHFLFSGEVLGQRPMSQTRSSLRYVEKRSGYDGLILRPLSAKRLPETIPEKKGWVNRDRLMEITGRSRKKQIALAAAFKLESYPSPAGGCLLTNKGYTTRLKELFAHSDDITEKDLYLLKYGRHFRLENGTKFIVGRSESDNGKLIRHFDPGKDVLICFFQVPGPIVLIPEAKGYTDIKFAAQAGAGYSKAIENGETSALVVTPEHHAIIRVAGLRLKDIRHFLIR